MQSATGTGDADPADVYDLTVEAAVDILGFDWCGVLLATEGYFEVVAASDESPVAVGDRPIPMDHGITGDVYRNGESHVIDDAHAHPEADPTLEAFRAGLTVAFGDRGVFQGISSEPGFFDDEDLELAELLIAHTEAAIDRIEETRRLNELNDATRSLMDAETHEAVSRVGCEIAASIPGGAATVFRYDADADELVPVATSDEAAALDDAAAIEPGEDPAWSVFGDTATRIAATDGDGGTTGAGEEFLYTALGDYGLLRVETRSGGAFEDTDVALAETLSANIEAAYARADRERRRREQARRLQRQNDRLDRFASVVSHDLRNPLAVASAATELAREECDSDHLVDVDDALARMDAMIDDTLSLAREGRAVEEPEPISLERIASQSWRQVDTDDVALEVVEDAVFAGDPDRLRNVFENLFRNSVEHGSTSSRPAADNAVEHGFPSESESVADSDRRVRVGILEDGFYVEDTGAGIPESDRDRIFEFGYSTDAEGTGFGLAIVAEIVDAHAWAIDVTDSEAGGARFEITGVDVEGQ